MLPNPVRQFRRLACLMLLLGVTACGGLNDPFLRAGTWQPEHINQTNIEAMVANPKHLQQGVGDDASPGVLSAAAVHRLLTDHVKALPTLSVGPISATASAPSGGTP